MNETLSEFLKFNKIMSVKLINNLATELKIGLTITDFSGDTQEYQPAITNVPDFSFIGQYTYQNRGIICAINPKIIISATQRCFGGKIDIKKYKSASFAFSENFIGKIASILIFNSPIGFNKI